MTIYLHEFLVCIVCCECDISSAIMTHELIQLLIVYKNHHLHPVNYFAFHNGSTVMDISLLLYFWRHSRLMTEKQVIWPDRWDPFITKYFKFPSDIIKDNRKNVIKFHIIFILCKKECKDNESWNNLPPPHDTMVCPGFSLPFNFLVQIW